MRSLFTSAIVLALTTFSFLASAKELTLGVFPRRNATATQAIFSPLAKHLTTALGREVRLVTAKDFTTFWQDVKMKKYDIVHYNQYHYLLSKPYGYQVFARNEEFGHDKVAGSIIVRKDSSIKTLKDLKGKTILFGGDQLAAQSYIVATHLLREGGLKPGDYKEEFAKNPPNAVMGVFYKQADAGGSGDVVLSLPVVTKKIDASQLQFLARSNPLPHLPWAIHKRVDDATRKRIIDAMTSLGSSPNGRELLKSSHVTNFVSTQDSDYDEHRKIVQAVTGEKL